MDDEEFRMIVVEKLDVLTETVKELAKLFVISPSLEKELADKKKGEQIKALSDVGLSRETIAFIVGSTPESVSSTLSQIKRKEKADKSKPKESEKDVQPTD